MCSACERRFTTFERVEEIELKVIKKGGYREPFDREKIRRGLALACWKRPVSDEQIENLITTIETSLYNDFEAEIEASVLGKIVMDQLAEIDQVAYVRFASVYREFKDASDFVDELQPILDSELQKKKKK